MARACERRKRCRDPGRKKRRFGGYTSCVGFAASLPLGLLNRRTAALALALLVLQASSALPIPATGGGRVPELKGKAFGMPLASNLPARWTLKLLGCASFHLQDRSSFPSGEGADEGGGRGVMIKRCYTSSGASAPPSHSAYSIVALDRSAPITRFVSFLRPAHSRHRPFAPSVAALGRCSAVPLRSTS